MDVVKKNNFCFLFLSAFILLNFSCSQQKTIESVTSSYANSSACSGQAIENRFIVQWEDGSFSVEHGKDMDEFRQSFVKENLPLIKHVDLDRKIQLPKQVDIQTENQASIFSEQVRSLSASLNWGPQMIQAPTLWNKNLTGDGVAVAVIDGMVDVEHTQLKPNILVNLNEIPNNGIDDDHNGFVDDIYGVQINKELNNPSVNRHGSHVAGIIAADSSVGPIQGVAPKAKIIPAQFIGNDEGGSLGDAIIAMNYAASRGAKIMNMSWGGAPCVPNLQAAMKALSDRGILLVTASGNEGTNVDKSPSYPSAFNLANQINVAASTVDDFMIYFSNFGFTNVHVAAPGVDIYSTVPGNKIELMSGTSMASPMTAGAAALLWGAFPQATAQQIKSALFKGVVVRSGHEFQVATRGRIDVSASYQILKNMLGQ